MKCSKCGFEAAQDNLFCPQCGERLTQIEAPTGVFSARILPALKDPLFLVVCILLSVSCLMSLAAGSVPLINILITVFLWLTYVQAQKNIASASYLRCVSGTLFAQYVINFVAASLVLVLGVALSTFLSLLANNMDAFMKEMADPAVAAILSRILPFASGTLLMVICVLVSIVMIVLNIFVMRCLHRFAQSVYRSIEQEVCQLKYTAIAKILLFILGGLSAIGCLSSLFTFQLSGFLASAATSGSAILSGLLVHKYLDTKA